MLFCSYILIIKAINSNLSMSQERIGEISKEIVQEWYKEKGVSPEEMEGEKEKEKKEEKEEQERLSSFDPPPPKFTPLTEKEQEEVEMREKEKELLVKDKIKNLLNLAEEKGLERSIKEAEKENDPFLLDVYHDVLAKEAAYKRFLEK